MTASTTTPYRAATGDRQQGEPVAMVMDMERVKRLRDYLRELAQSVGSDDTVPMHRAALARLWQLALECTGGDVAQALAITREAVRCDPQSGESLEETRARIAAIPWRAFGSTAPFAGIDKPQQFFAVAYWSYVSGKYLSSGAGRAVVGGLGRMDEWKDAFLKTIQQKATGDYDEGDIHVDDRGAEFASFLLTSPATPINLFLRMPGESRFGRLSQIEREADLAPRPPNNFLSIHRNNGRTGDDCGYSPAESDLFVPPALDEVLHALNILVWSDRTVTTVPADGPTLQRRSP